MRARGQREDYTTTGNSEEHQLLSKQQQGQDRVQDHRLTRPQTERPHQDKQKRPRLQENQRWRTASSLLKSHKSSHIVRPRTSTNTDLLKLHVSLAAICSFISVYAQKQAVNVQKTLCFITNRKRLLLLSFFDSFQPHHPSSPPSSHPSLPQSLLSSLLLSNL